MAFSRKRHRSDSSSERKIADGEDTDAKGRTMKDPANGLELYRNSRGEETTMFGHGPREKGARPYYEVYSVWFEGHLVATANARSTAGEIARKLRSEIPTGTRGELLDDRNRLMSVVKRITDENVAHMSNSELKEAYEGRDDREKWYGHSLSAEEIAGGDDE